MSDALSDISRDQMRGCSYQGYLNALRNFLEGPTVKNKNLVISAAKSTNSIQGGFWGSGQTGLSGGIKERLELLKNGDNEAWAEFLFGLEEDDFQEFKALSPFSGKLLVTIDYGHGFVTLRGDIEVFLRSLIANGKGWQTYNGDKYFVALEQPNPETAEIFWIGGSPGINGPRKSDKKLETLTVYVYE